ncbi:hypothetical protein FQN50_008502 [Emmonsiellopsis sp. PD_5]|nr:hypothetical protein FQN50_008502 [Emmonsiellopsis sp. PD_5]
MELFRGPKRQESPCTVLLAVAAAAGASAAAYHNSQNSTLYSLPPELVEMISSYLPLHSAVSLMITCARFWNSRIGSGIFAPIWQQLRRWNDDDEDTRYTALSARFHVLRMLEYDGKLSDDEYCCWGHLTIHQRTAFSFQELAKGADLKVDFNPVCNQSVETRDANGRYCLITKTCAQIGLCRDLRFPGVAGVWGPHWSWPTTWFYGRIPVPRFPVPGYFFWWFGRIVHYWSIPILRNHVDMSSNRVIPRIQSMNFPICPHTNLADPEMLELYTKWKQSRADWTCRERTYSCKGCKTTVILGRSPRIVFHIRRDFGRFDSPKDADWLAQSFGFRDPRLIPYCKALKAWYLPADDDALFEPDVPRPDLSRVFRPVILVDE